jgi:hypothetical protein
MLQARFPATPVMKCTDENPQDILGQFYYALGQGAGAMRVQRSAIAALRARYYGPIQAAPGPWKTISPNVLGFVAQVGRLAALFATQAGRTAIDETDFTSARRIVESRVHQGAEAAGMLIAGPMCPPVAGESDPLPPGPIPSGASDSAFTVMASGGALWEPEQETTIQRTRPS